MAEPGPYSRKKMRALGGLTGLFAVLFLVWGGISAAGGDRGGRNMLILGIVFVVLLAVGIPLGIKRGRL
ncbi:hypothetical protein [Paractinoplanes lichenicola]|uniref:Uncharacterized protein n=1 Tax=Paractinoplanes lichenicola TaxID=2802976 RepID=A0ABS1VZY9_9ACTN|nr:hypothetical protein [Actinoplanes lichenicola]MBL7260022.1 hypothetical protein [Actinoplanes lichenicola]